LKLKTSSLLIAGALFGAAVMPAQANNEAMMDLLKVLRDQGTITAENYELLTSAAKADKEVVEDVVNKVAAAEKKMPKISTKGKIKIESADGNYSFQPIGRVMWDAVAVDGDNNGAGDFKGTELRRARLGFSGKAYNWGYKFEADFATAGKAGKSVALKDAYVSYNTKLAGNKLGVKFGQSQIAFGFNTASSSKYMTFMDRPLFADKDTSPARQSGVAAQLLGKDWTLATSITQGSLSSGTAEDPDNGTTFAARGTFMPYHAGKTQLVQLGGGYMRTGGSDDSFSFSNHLTAHEDPVSIKSATLSGADYDGSDAFGFDAVAIFGSFHAMGEYNAFTADSKSNNDIDVDSFAVEAGYFLTGESMKLKKGLWSGVTPKSSSGAWQIASRFETTEIDDGLGNNNQEVDMWTIGVNYYANSNVRFMLDYSDVTSFDSAGVSQPEPSAIKFRAQAKW
jgi:phosphate-selective porin OprO/OprP